jgi:hypothetical protein
MGTIYRKEFTRAIIGTLCAAILYCTSCSSSPAILPDEVRSNPPGTLKAYLIDGRLITLTHYSIVGSTLSGFGEIESRTGRRPFQGSIKMDSIERFENPAANHTGLIAVVVLGIAGVVYSLYNNTVMTNTGNIILN